MRRNANLECIRNYGRCDIVKTAEYRMVAKARGFVLLRLPNDKKSFNGMHIFPAYATSSKLRCEVPGQFEYQSIPKTCCTRVLTVSRDFFCLIASSFATYGLEDIIITEK